MAANDQGVDDRFRVAVRSLSGPEKALAKYIIEWLADSSSYHEEAAEQLTEMANRKRIAGRNSWAVATVARVAEVLAAHEFVTDKRDGCFWLTDAQLETARQLT